MTFESLVAPDGHPFAAYRAPAQGERRGGLVLIQEIFGINGHIQKVADGYAAQGYEVLAPALFDRVERDVQLGYAEADVARGRGLRTTLGWDLPFLDLGAAVADLSARGPVATLGYCWGGSLSWLAASRLPIQGAVVYYGAQVPDWLTAAPRCPVLAHFGERDPLIPGEKVAALAAAHPMVAVHRYPAGHGFNCDHRADYQPTAARIAQNRTLAFLQAIF
ncbi:MAG: dienelactone hydrolase family protein [Deltaproteobacteria bacterium]|nr:dienelactone hydrolase family protein [Deltaproteobacteria bacterium]